MQLKGDISHLNRENKGSVSHNPNDMFCIHSSIHSTIAHSHLFWLIDDWWLMIDRTNTNTELKSRIFDLMESEKKLKSSIKDSIFQAATAGGAEALPEQLGLFQYWCVDVDVGVGVGVGVGVVSPQLNTRTHTHTAVLEKQMAVMERNNSEAQDKIEELTKALKDKVCSLACLLGTWG